MGSTFVTLGRDVNGRCTAEVKDEVGFWMNDAILQLWLRLLALHIVETGQPSNFIAVIRDQWLLASQHGFVGMVPHDLDKATATDEGLHVVRNAVISLDHVLRDATEPLPPQELNLLGLAATFNVSIDPEDLRDVASAFLDLLNFNIQSTTSTQGPYPGSRRKLPLH